MKTCLFSLCYLDGNDAQGNNRFDRNLRYLDYYSELKDKLGFSHIFLGDNDSSVGNCAELYFKAKDTEFSFLHLGEHIERGPGFVYPHLWRGLYSLRRVIGAGYDKIILIDSDCFVLTQKAADYIKGLTSGWTTLWCPKYNFPEAAIQVLCRDAYPVYYSFINQCEWGARPTDSPMEILLPFTHTEMSLKCDRWGEERRAQESWMDVYCQANLDIPMVFS